MVHQWLQTRSKIMNLTLKFNPSQQQAAPTIRLLLAVLGILAISACAVVPDAPNESLRAAQQAITNAERAQIVADAMPELTQARQKLAEANNAVQQERMVLAERLAHESQVNAELALAKSEMIKARTVNREMQASIDALNQEILRQGGGNQ
jgi:capsule polysaccharide export protein KpsE/RkpR